jgi:general secretion pathway protein A
MYKRFFGFKERPFKLLPDPAYFYMSRCHEEAMAHLAYAVSQGDGFVLITGEVGTGKTTLCRAFLESLDIDTEAAYIFNPKLDSLQLLKTINDEFGIPSESDSTKDLIDTLNGYLIEQKGRGFKTVLIIDEAQNLTRDVLEQLRLLSNLETTKEKLLQIILLGQPELGEMLDSYELRQLAQRVTLSCHLTPLTFKETQAYIQHRIHVSSQRPGIRFNRSAVRTIYSYAGGIPRLINIACDRALLTAFGRNQQRISGNIARMSIRELSGKGKLTRGGFREQKTAVFVLVLLCLTLSIIVFNQLEEYHPNAKLQPSGTPPGAAIQTRLAVEKPAPKAIKTSDAEQEKIQIPLTDSNEKKNHLPEPVEKSHPITVPIRAVAPQKIQIPPAEANEKKGHLPVSVEEPERVEKPQPEENSESSRRLTSGRVQEQQDPGPVLRTAAEINDLLKDTNRRSSRRSALESAIKLWKRDADIRPHLDEVDEDPVFFRLAAKQNGLSVHRIKGDGRLIRNLNLPTVIEWHSADGRLRGHMAVIKMDEQKIILAGARDGKPAGIDPGDFARNWSGIAYIIWKNFMSVSETISLDSSKESIIALKMSLRDIGFDDIDLTPVYNDSTENAVRAIQKTHGIPVDGIVGPLTKIAIYNENNALQIPHLH